jgi:hypothetical protein
MKTAVPWALVVALGWVAIQSQCAQRELEAASEQLASLRTAVLEERTAAQGWRTQLVQATSELEAQLQDSRDRGALLEAEKAELAREIQTLGGRLAIMADLYADARGQIVAHAEVHVADSSASNEAGNPAMPDSITAPVDDGLLTGKVSYYPPRNAFGLDYRISLGITLAASEAPDGQTLVTAMAEHERVSLRFGEIKVAAPRQVEHCSLTSRVQTSAVAIGAWELGKFFFGSATGGGS